MRKLSIAVLALLAASPALATLTATPITWNVIGLDSNSPAAGPNRFPAGARVCSNVATTNVVVNWVFDSANPNINLRPGSLTSITFPSIAAGACADAYFEIEITPVAAAYDTTRRYHITASDFSGTVSTPVPREVYVEHLISQSRNSTTDVKLNGVSVPAGGSMSLVVGTTYTIELDGGTATQGYAQLEEFLNFSNTIFQILSVSTTYAADTSPFVPNPNDKLYADACGWENDPNSPNYRSCVGGAGKTGGTVNTIYTVKIIGGGGTIHTLSSLTYDFSGSSYHYNSDLSVGGRIASIIDPTLVTISKNFTPDPSTVGGVSTLTFTLTNPNGGSVGGLNFSDVFPIAPGAMVVANPPGATTTGCGAPTFAPAAGAGSVSFSNGTVAANSSCTVSVKVTTPTAGTYSNTSGHLFIGSVDTGSFATDTLTVSATPPPPPPVCGVTMANWSVPDGTLANPPDLLGGVPTVKAANVATATVAANLPGSTSVLTVSGHGDSTSWRTFGYKTLGQFITFTVDTSKYTAVQMSFWVGNPSPANGPTQYTLTVDNTGTGTGFGAPVLTVNNPPLVFTNQTVNLTGLTNTTGNTLFRLTATGANNDNAAASLNYDDIVFTGCTVPGPPTIAKAFAPNPVAVGATSTLTFTLTNPNAVAETGLAFTDTLPAGLTAPNGTTTPCGGSLVITGGNLLTFSGGTLAAGGSCTIPVTVTATTAGPHANVSGFVSSTTGGTNTGATGVASASLTAVLPPSIAKQFAPSSILALGVSTLTFTVTNPNQNDTLSSVAFSDTFPTSPGAMVVAAAPGASTSGCGAPTFAPVAGAGSVSFTGGTIAGGATCTVTVNVTAPAVGAYANTSGSVSTVINGVTVNGNTAAATLTVTPAHPAIGILKQVGLTSNPLGTWSSFIAVTAGTNVFYKITIENDGDVPLSPVSASDPNVNLAGCVWPPTLPVAVAGNENHIATCVVGPVAAVAGLHPNTATASGTGGGSTVTDSSTATYATTGLSIAKSAAETTFSAAGDLLHYSYLVTNSGFATLAGPVTVTDTKVAVTCPALTTIGDLDAFFDPGEAMTCTATYTVTAADVAALSVTNQAFATVSGVNSPTASKTVPLAGILSITKSFGAPSVALGSTVNMSFLISNPSGTPLTGIAFTDTLPAGLTAANGTTTPCGGTLTVSGGNSLSFSGGSLGAGASCTINVTVTGATAGVKNNTTGPISSNEGGVAGTSNTATVTVVGPPTIVKSFAAPDVALGGSVNMSFLLSNSSTTPLTGVAFSDTLPAGLTAPNGTTTPCGGSLVVAGGNSLTFSGGTLAASGNCTITVPVTGATAGVKNNTTGPISSTESGAGSPSNTATVTVLAPPTIGKTFGAGSIPLSGTTSLDLTLTNPNATVALSGIAFTDSLPAGLTAPNGTTTPCGGTLTITGGNLLTFTGGTLAAAASCPISVTVTGATTGVKNNTTSAITSTGPIALTGTTSNTATVTVTPPGAPTITKSFAAPEVALGGTVVMSFLLNNPSATPLTGVTFSDTLPAGLTAPNGTTTPCGGSLVITGGTGLAFTGGTLGAGGSCTITVTVTGAVAGVQNNTTGPISSNESGAGGTSNTATVTVLAPPTIAKAFGAGSIPLAGTTSLDLTLANPNATVALTGVSFTDALPAGLTAPNGTTTPCGGTLTITGGNLLTFTGGTLAAGTSCPISITVTGVAIGAQSNTTSAITSTGPIPLNGTTSNTATVTVTAPGAPTITKSFAGANVALGGTVGMSFLLSNTSVTPLTGVAFSDTLPAGLTAPNGTTAQCGGSLTVTGGNTLTFSGGTLAASGSCTITVTVTGALAGVQNNTTGPISSNESGAGGPSNTATVTVVAPPTIAKAFGAPSIALSATTSLDLTLANPNATVALTGVDFTDSLPSGLTAPNGTTTPCGGTLTITGGNLLTFAGGMLAAGANCTITVTVTGASAGVQNNTTSPVTASGPVSLTGTVSNTATVTVTAPNPPTIAKSFAAPDVALGGAVNMSFLLSNASVTPLTGVAFSDSLPAGLTAPNGTTTPCGGSLVISGGTTLTFSGGTLAASGSCTITVAVTGATAGVKNNTTGPIGSTESGPGSPSNTATLTVVAPPAIGKSFGAPSIALSGTTNLDVTLTNPNVTLALSGIAFTDSLPAGLTAPNGTTTPCGGTLTITGGNLLTFTGGTLAAAGSCTISVTVTGVATGIQNNTTSPVTATGPVPLTGTPSNTATVTVAAPGPPTIAKSFAAPDVALGGSVNMSFLLTNSSATPLTGVAFSDTLPAGLTAPNGTTTPCGGTLVIAGGNGLTFSGGTLSAGGSCTITVPVTGATAGVKNNTTGPIGSIESGPGAASNTAAVTVLAPPTIGKTFGAGSIPLSGTTSLDLTLTNPNATVALSGIGFTDALPAGLTAPNGTTTPCGGSLTITLGNLLTFTGGTLAAGGNCTISVTVTGVAAGIQNNTTSAITSTGPIALTGTTSNTATVTVTAPGAPTITKSFAAPDVALGGTVDMSFLLNNPSATPLTGVAFTDSLPAGLTAPNGTTTPCGGSLVISGGTGLAFSGGTLAAGGSCTITVTVTGAVAGVENNTTGPISSNESGAGGASNTATVTVLAPPTITKAFGAGSIPLAGTTSLDLTLTNPNATVALTGVDFTDALPAGLTAPNGTTTPCGGTLTITGGNLLTFTGGTLAAGVSCPISITVTGVAIGAQNNTTSPITAAGPIALTGAQSNTATVTVTAPGAPTIAKSFAGANVALGGTVGMSFVLNNPSVTPLTGVTFADSLPAGLTAPNGTTAQCGGSLVITGGNLLTFSGGGLAPGASCTVTVTVTGAAAGIQNNTTGPISSNESGAGGPSNTATVAVLAPPTIAKAFGAGSIPLSGTTTLDLTLTNPDATAALTGVDFTDALPAGLTAPNGTTTPCGGTLTISGGNLLTFTGGTLAAGASCPISITVTGVAIGIQNNTTSPVTASGPVSLTGAPSNTATVTVTAPGAPTITKSFAGADVALGGAINVSFLLNNPSVTPLTGVSFSDSLPAGLTAANGTIAACGGTLTVSGGNLLTFSGGTLAASTGCTVTVAVTGAAAGVQNNTTGPIGSNESGPGGASNTATVTVVAPPTIAKAFAVGSISVGATTSLTLTLTNPNATVALTGVAFTDSLPSGLTAGNGTTAPCGGLLSITGGNLLTFTGGTLGAGAGCTITVTVTGATAGIQNNTTSPVTATGPVSLTGVPSNTATVTVTAPGAPTIAKSFSAANVALGGAVNVSFVITNPGQTTLTGLAFTDTLPSGLTAPNGTAPTCGGTLTIGGGNLLTFSGGTLAGGASCTITVTLTGSAAGAQNNTTGPISSTETGAGAPSNTATVTVIAPPTIAKTFGVSSMPVNGTTSLDLTLTNPNATVALSGLAFTDTLPSGLTAPNGTTTPCGGTLTITGGNLLTFSGGTLAAGASCTITVTVTGISTGAQNNTTSPLTASGPLAVTGTPSNTATVTVGTGAVSGIPTLGPWMLLSLAALLALAGVRFARR